MAVILSLAMIMPNMTVYASEYSELPQQTEETVENTETDAVELPSTEDGTVQDDAAQDEGTQDGTVNDETSQEGTEGDAQDTDASDENSNPGNDVEGGDASEPEEGSEEVQEPEETDADIQEVEDELKSAEVSEDVETITPRAGEHTLWLVGDSTVCEFNDAYFYPRYGYGTQIANYLDDTYTVRNLALSGRSSKSFLAESNYKTLTDGLSAGDVLVIGFGHNDEKNESARYTNPNGDYQANGSFAKSLYDNYVKKAIDVGAEVILCTPIVRRSDSDKLSDSNCHITSDATDSAGNTYPGGDYPAAIRKLVQDAGGADAGVYLVDLTNLTKNLYNEIGAGETLYLHAWTGGVGVDKDTGKDPGDPKSVDNTHLNIYGAKMVAWMFAKELSEKTGNNAPEIKAHIKSNIASLKPSKAVDLVSNPNYVKPDYTAPSGGSTLFPAYSTGDGIQFQASVFGDVGGADKITTSKFSFGRDANGDMQIAAMGQGKIASGSDGIAMYYYRIPVEKTFKISAKAKLNSFVANNQVAFGLMARDDMYIDTSATTIKSDYVVAGSIEMDKTGTNCFCRRSGSLVKGAALPSGVLAEGKEYDLSIEYNGDGFTCTFGDQEPQSGGYDFQLTSVDSKYVYVGMFVARNANVTFSNIHLEIEEDPGDYIITVSNDGNGTAKASKSSANAGDEITLTAFPKSGYAFKEWKVVSGGVTIKDNKFTMPAKSVEIKAIFEKLPVTIDVWDFGGKVDTDSHYNNHITPETLKAQASFSSEKGIYEKNSSITYGDLTQVNGDKDKLYTNIPALSDYNYGSLSIAQYAYEDGYTSAGAYFANGKGTEKTRYITIDNVKVGDKIVAYMGSSASGDIEFYFEGQSQKDSGTVASGTCKKFEFIAEYNGTYKIWTQSNGKPIYHRIMRIPSVEVSGSVDLNDNYITDGYSIKFVNQTTKKEYVAVVEAGGTFTANLPAGYIYKAALVGVTGYGFTIDSATLQVTDDDAITGKSGVKLVVEYKSTYTFSGTIRGFDADYNLDNLEILMIPNDSAADDVELQITKDSNDNKLTFTAEIAQNQEYSFVLKGANDYQIVSPLVINTENEGTSYENRIIVVTTKPVYNVIGGFSGLDSSANVSSLIFTNVEDNYSYTAQVAGGAYSVDLRDGEYSASATVTGYETKTHVVVDGGSVSKDLLFVSTADKGPLDKKPDIYVGYPTKADNYATVKEAVEACKRMNPTNDKERITVHIAPGTYREQIIIDTPYISFVNDTDEEVLLTWYYGIGYKYYSADSSGFYNPENAYDKFDKHSVAKWGTTVYLNSKAQAFRAEGITFENSFNRYMTDEEIEDGVEVSGEERINVKRYQGLDVTSKAATERASVIVIDKDADNAEFLNCNFYSSQDTVMTGGAHTYFRNCVIEGQTDYICGKGNCVFDACELRWKGYSTGTGQGGYLAVSQADVKQKGYLFRNCTVTANSKLEVTPGYWGRPWSENAGVVFMNTKLQNAGLIVAKGWTEMSGTQPSKERMKEYNTTTIAGETVDTSERSDYVMTPEAAAAIKISDYLGDWTPEYYNAEAETVAISGDVRVTDNADINTPKAGNTLTVIYSLGENDDNDASIISWYAVEKENGAEKENSAVLLKVSTATVDKTYKVDKGLEGKYIKVIVSPQTVSGKTGDAKSYILENAIADGYEDPSNPDGDIALGDGINIFLAGDSTVKDYSAAGMYNSGATLNEGSWGEFIQTFFNESEVKIQNYAQGGRSSRTFINEGKLKAIEDKIGEGDYLFIQFGHNDASDKYPDRYVPLGDPVDGKYPSTPGTLDSKGEYPDGGNGTFKWFLQQYIKTAKDKGAIPVLVTPVSRMYYNSDGTISAHHDKESSSNKNNAYVTAVKQLAEENNVLLIDGFDVTKKLFEEAWEADGKNSDVYGTQIMNTGDKTHNNKLGGMIEAAAIASEIQKMGIDISYAVKTPAKVAGLTPDGKTVFSVDADSKITANDINSGYENRTLYWETVGQEMIDIIKTKAGQLGAETPVGSVSVPTATPSAGAVEKGTSVALSVIGSAADSVEIYYTTDGSSPKTKDNTATKLYSESTNIIINENTTIKAYAKEKVESGEEPTLTDSKVVTFVYTLLPSVKAPILKAPAETTVKAGTTIKLGTGTEDAQIRYTMGSNPADPTVNSPLYNDTKGIVITSSTTLKAIAVKDGETSSVATFVFTIESGGSTSVTVATPTSDTDNGAVELRKVIHLNTTTENALIYFTKGTTPADPTKSNADLYDDSEGIVIDRNMTIKAIAVVGDSTSTVATFKFTVPTTETPKADKEAGVVAKGTQIILKCDTTDAVIYYTDDRTSPKTSGTRIEYKEPIVIERTTTIRAYAVCKDLADSEVVTYTYTVKSKDVGEGLQIVLDKDKYTYTGSTIIPSYTVYYNEEEIYEGTHYTVKYSNNTKVPTTDNIKKHPTITVKGKGNFSGAATKTFTISTASLKGAYNSGKLLVNNAISTKNYDKLSNELGLSDDVLEDINNIDAIMCVVEKKKLTPVMYYNGVKLTAKEYTLSKTDAWKADGKVTLTGKTNFSGVAGDALNIYVHVVKSSELKKITKVVLKDTSYTYDGTDTWEKQSITVSDRNGVLDASNYTVTFTGDTTNVGKVKVTVVGVGLYTGSITKTYTIKPNKSADKISITTTIDTDGYQFESTGTTLDENDIKVVYNDGSETGKTLNEGSDYKITYKNNKRVGTGKYSITFLGNYKGIKTKNLTGATGTFKINKAKFDDLLKEGRLDVVTADKSFNKAGAAYKSAPYVSIDNVLLKASNYTVNYYVGDSTTSVKNPKLSAVGTVYIEITGKGNYEGIISTVTAGEGAEKIKYEVYKPASASYDLSKATVTFKQNGKVTKKVDYTGDVIDEDTVEVIVTPKGGKENIADKCTIEFVNNKNKGKATVVIKANAAGTEAGYTGSKTAKLTISAVKWK